MTVDIAALREECVKWVDETLPGLINTRQPKNGDVGDFMAFDMAVIFKTWVHLSGKLEAAQARIAELESEQEPVWYFRKMPNGTYHPLSKSTAVMDMIPLYTSPPKPVIKLSKRTVGEVMHMSGFDRQYAEGWCSANEWAINQAKLSGITVESE